MKKLIFILSLGICFTQTADVDNNKSSSNISDKKNSIGIGLTTNKTQNLIQYTRDYKLSDNHAIFGSISPFSVGLGMAWQSNYNANGIMMAGSVGYVGDTFGNLSLSYQWRLGKSSNFFSLGVNSGYHFECDECESDLVNFVPLPVISFDRRF